MLEAKYKITCLGVLIIFVLSPPGQTISGNSNINEIMQLESHVHHLTESQNQRPGLGKRVGKIGCIVWSLGSACQSLPA